MEPGGQNNKIHKDVDIGNRGRQWSRPHQGSSLTGDRVQAGRASAYYTSQTVGDGLRQ
jgi:hypothetical protein